MHRMEGGARQSAFGYLDGKEKSRPATFLFETRRPCFAVGSCAAYHHSSAGMKQLDGALPWLYQV